jgi:predicted phosphodiesterase
MPRPRSKRNTGQIFLYALSFLVVLSMALGYALISAPPPTSAPQPTSPAGTQPPGATPRPTAQASRTASPAPSITPLPLPARATPDPAATAYSFAVIGDNSGNLPVYTALLKQIAEDGNSFVLHLGNLVTDGTAAEFQGWRETLAGFALPLYPIPGNRDANQGSLANYLAFSGAPAAHYSFDRGRAHFALVDSSREYLTAEESAWLDADLAATQKPVKIVAIHYPPFDPRGSNQVMSMGNQAFMSLMRKRGVKIVLSGHIHTYDQTNRDGVTYIISGGGGAELNRAEADGGFYHYVQVRVNGTDIQTEVRRLK